VAASSITHLERRKIEAGVIVPIAQAFQRALGKEAANAILREAILELARTDSVRWAAQFGGDLTGLQLQQLVSLWTYVPCASRKHCLAAQPRGWRW
jgi:hypothetical protein